MTDTATEKQQLEHAVEPVADADVAIEGIAPIASGGEQAPDVDAGQGDEDRPQIENPVFADRARIAARFKAQREQRQEEIVDAAHGEIAGDAVRAEVTVTFHAAKPGLWIAPGKMHAGDVTVIDIGIPDGAPVTPSVGLIAPEALDGVPHRAHDSTKFAAGALMVCGGSTGLTGAPCMAAEAAMRAGAGYVTATVPASLHLVFETRLLEVMSVPLPDQDGALQRAGVPLVLERLGVEAVRTTSAVLATML